MDITGRFVYDYDNTVWTVNIVGLLGELDKIDRSEIAAQGW